MLAWLTAVIQDSRVLASGFFESVGQDGHSVETTAVVDGLSQGNHLGGETVGVESDRMEGVAENVTEVAGPVHQDTFVGIVEQWEVTGNGRVVFRCHCREHCRT